MLRTGVQGSFQPSGVSLRQERLERFLVPRCRRVAYIQGGEHLGHVALSCGSEVIHIACHLPVLSLAVGHSQEMADHIRVKVSLINSQIAVLKPSLLRQMTGKIVQEVLPKSDIPAAAHRIALRLHGAIFPVGKGISPGKDTVDHHLVRDADLILTEGYPGIKIAVVIRKLIPRLRPPDHGRIVNLIGAVGLSAPGVLNHRSRYGIAADLPVFLHDRTQNLQMLLGEGLHAVILGAAVRILPQTDIKRKLFGIWKHHILHQQTVCKFQGFLKPLCLHRQSPRVQARLRVRGYSKLHPYGLQAVKGNIYRAALLIENIRGFQPVPFRDGTCRAAVTNISAAIVIGQGRFHKRERHLLLGNLCLSIRRHQGTCRHADIFQGTPF